VSGRSESETLAKASQKFDVPQDKIVLTQGEAGGAWHQLWVEREEVGV